MTTAYCFLETEKISDIIDMSSDRNTYVGLEKRAGSEIDPLCEMCTRAISSGMIQNLRTW